MTIVLVMTLRLELPGLIDQRALVEQIYSPAEVATMCFNINLHMIAQLYQSDATQTCRFDGLSDSTTTIPMICVIAACEPWNRRNRSCSDNGARRSDF